jgi:small subunit ribosomal protein S18
MSKEQKKSRRSKYRPEYPAEFIFDYKDPSTLYRFIMEGGKIAPSRISKLSNAQQRRVAEAVKKARNLCLLPTGNDAYDSYRRPEMVAPKPFQI